MKTTRLLFCAALLSCTLGNLQAQSSIKGCNGKTYNVGDTLRFGKSAHSGYNFINQFAEDGNFKRVDGDKLGHTLIISEIPSYNQKLYEDMAIFDKPAEPLLVIAENETEKYCIDLNHALGYGDIISEYKESFVDGFKELDPAALFAYSMNLYNLPIDDKAIDTYASLCDAEASSLALSNPFELDGLRSVYKSKLDQAIKEVDFNQVYRIKCLSELGTYDMEKATFPLQGFYPLDVTTEQKAELSKLKYCLWGECAFHFINSTEFSSINCPKDRARGMYDLRKCGKPIYDNTIMLTSYVYVRFLNKPVTLPKTEIRVKKSGDSFGFDYSTLDKVYGKKSLLMEIIQVDGYLDLVDYKPEGGVVYNYLGSKSK